MKILFQFLLFAAIILLDRMSKAVALAVLDIPLKLNSILSFQLIMNKGIACGFLNNLTDYSYLSCLVIIVYLLLGSYAYVRFKNCYSVIGEILVLAGGFSNLIDRFYYDGVVDFILIQYKDWSWPVFNVADIAIVLGILIMLIQSNYENK